VDTIVNRWWDLSERRLKEVESITSKLSDMAGGNIARLEMVAKSLRTTVVVVLFVAFAYLMLYSYSDSLGPWKATALGFMICIAANQYLLDY